MEMDYNRIAQFVAMAAITKKFSYQERFTIKKGYYKIKFSSYVKSQVHLNITKDLFERSITEYAKALYFLEGYNEYRDTAVSVLGYYYYDMYRCLVNNPESIEIQLNVDAKLDLPVKQIDCLKVMEQLTEIIDAVNSKSNVEGSINGFEFSAILDDIDDFEEMCIKKKSFALAAIFKYAYTELMNGRPFILEVINEDRVG